MDRVEHWQKVYSDKRPEEVSWYQPAPGPSLAALDRIGLGKADSLVDAGGGASGLVDALLERGWRDLTVVDVAAAALAASRARLGGKAGLVTWVEADLCAWRPDRTFAVWHDRAVFHFLTSAEARAGYRAALLAATEAGSAVIVAAFAADGPEACSGLPVRRYDAALLAAELGEAFAPVADWRETHRTPSGAGQRFQWCAFSRK